MDTQKPEENTPDVSAGEASSAGTLEGQLAAISAERDRLNEQNGELEDRLLRLRAEFENFRRRVERERSEYLQFASMESVREILPVLDDFERALKAETEDRAYAKGVELIFQRLSDTLKKMGLEPIEAVGQRFDPTVHEAIQRVETEEADDQTVLEEYQRGYAFKGKLLRPAMVKVAVKS